MQSIDHLVDAVANFISQRSTEPGTFYFSETDLKYAYSQILLDPYLRKHCNFNILGGQATGTYRFPTGYYGLTDMPATSQKTVPTGERKPGNKITEMRFRQKRIANQQTN